MKTIILLTIVTLSVFAVTRQVDVPCAGCGETAETQPLFIYLTFPLPDTLHYECFQNADFTALPFQSYPRYRDRSCCDPTVAR